MTVILLLMALAGTVGFLLSVYIFFYRLQLKAVWRWLGGVVGGIILGGFLSFLILFMFWPPVENLLIAGGLGFIAIIIMLVLDFPKVTVPSEEDVVELNAFANNKCY